MKDLRVIADGALLIRNGYIQQVGPTRRVERLIEARGAEVIDAHGRVIIPGFVDCFTRLVCGPPLLSADASRRALRGYSAQRMELEAARRLGFFVQNGTTTLGASCGFGIDGQTEMKALRAIERLNAGTAGIVPQYFGACYLPADDDEPPAIHLERLATEALPALMTRGLSRTAVISDAYPPGAAAGFLGCARRLGYRTMVVTPGKALPMAIEERADTVCGVEDVPDAAARAIAASPASVVLLPGRVLQRGSVVYPDARLLIDAGATVALGTGFDPLESPTMSLPLMMSLACAQMRITAAEALTAATINAAWALGCAGQVGSIEPGKRADLLMMDCADYQEIPLYFGMNLVSQVFRAGCPVYPHRGPGRHDLAIERLTA